MMFLFINCIFTSITVSLFLPGDATPMNSKDTPDLGDCGGDALELCGPNANCSSKYQGKAYACVCKYGGVHPSCPDEPYDNQSSQKFLISTKNKTFLINVNDENEVENTSIKKEKLDKSDGTQVTLQRGSRPGEGNVFINGQPVCDDDWDDTDAGVVCRQLGYSSGSSTTRSKYGSVPTNFIMDDVNCDGSETNILDCSHLSDHNCGSSEGAGVICEEEIGTLVTLQGGSLDSEGNVFINGQPVCDDAWDDTDAGVVCRQLGYSSGSSTTQSTYGSVPTNFIMDDVDCDGSETNILDCSHLADHNCGGSEGAGVICEDSGPTQPCQCGQAQRGVRIINGVATEINEYPWQAALVRPGSSFIFCGGSLINSKWVMTAAHCTEGSSASNLEVLLGEHDKTTSTETTTVRMSLADVIDHPEYNGNTLENDFSLLQFQEHVDFSLHPHIRPVCLPAANAGYSAGDEMVVTGWGTTSAGSFASVLQETTVSYMTNSDCNNLYQTGPRPPATITSDMLCCAEPGTDACQGDSGGPLVRGRNADNDYELAGVVSWGYGCADPNYPGVYSRVSEVVSSGWVTSNVVDGDWCPSA